MTKILKKKGTATALSSREIEVLKWCSMGKSNGVIAEILGVSEKTIEFHFTSIFRKFGVDGRMLAVLKGIQLGLITVA